MLTSLAKLFNKYKGTLFKDVTHNNLCIQQLLCEGRNEKI